MLQVKSLEGEAGSVTSDCLPDPIQGGCWPCRVCGLNLPREVSPWVLLGAGGRLGGRGGSGCKFLASETCTRGRRDSRWDLEARILVYGRNLEQ